VNIIVLAVDALIMLRHVVSGTQTVAQRTNEALTSILTGALAAGDVTLVEVLKALRAEMAGTSFVDFEPVLRREPAVALAASEL
jgi:uncharacterized tellurite resistance protein B-like protein